MIFPSLIGKSGWDPVALTVGEMAGPANVDHWMRMAT
jgi:hypothetical protein